MYCLKKSKGVRKMRTDIVVGIADMKVIKGEGTIVTYALGSCVGICMYEEESGLGGMVHAMLPDSAHAVALTSLEKYVDTGIDKLYRTLCHMGADRTRLRAKLIGGAKMFEYRTVADEVDIGTANVLQAKKLLRKLGVALVCEVTGGMVGRTIRFQPTTGKVMIQSTDQKVQVI